MIFLLDNYDSFTYNLSQLLQEIGSEVIVKRNDEISVDEIMQQNPSYVMLSPGPGRPENAGIMQELINTCVAKETPLFGVCLGMQGIGMHFGAKVIAAKKLMHGKTCKIKHDGKGVFENLANDLEVMRYHSLALADIPNDSLTKSASSEDDELMAFRHNSLPIEAVQFHPESFATDKGKEMMSNFLNKYQ